MLGLILLFAAPLLLVSACAQQKRLADRNLERCRERPAEKASGGEGNTQLLVPECPTDAQRWTPAVY